MLDILHNGMSQGFVYNHPTLSVGVRANSPTGMIGTCTVVCLGVLAGFAFVSICFDSQDRKAESGTYSEQMMVLWSRVLEQILQSNLIGGLEY